MISVKKKRKNNNVPTGNLVIIASFLFFALIIGRGAYLALSTNIDGINIKEFSSSRTTRTDTLTATRGKIYDVNGETLAENVYSYTLIAYLDPDRTTNENNPQHVVDKEGTAQALSTVIDMSYEEILALLNKEGVYQTEFGKAGKSLNEIQKDKILALGLPGIDFIETQTRYYPNGNFLSYAIGYAKTDSSGEITGEMGIEKQYDDILSGTDGYVTYQKDRNGYKISGTDEIRVEAEDGDDVYLTVDSSIQLFVEQAIAESAKQYAFDGVNIMVADAETGAILASASYPSFDPNTRNDIVSYLDPNVSIGTEPGSTMKIYTYMAAMEAGKYNGNDTYLSGIYTAQDGTQIGDHDRAGWGVITYDYGFAQSSNVAVANLVTKYIDRATLGNYFKKLGFGSKTGIELPNEASGKISFQYETEVINASFGQGILTTPIQNIKALTAIANDGVLLQPYIVDKIVDGSTGEVTYQGERTELGQVASSSTVTKMKQLMHDVVDFGTGSIYAMEGYDLIAKTGTAQIASTDGSGYLTGEYDVIRGFAGIYPAENPKLIIYATMTRPQSKSARPLSMIIDQIIVNATQYYGIDTTADDNEVVDPVVENLMPSFINQTINNATTTLTEMGVTPYVLGNGTKVVSQYPAEGTTITNKEKVFLVTNDDTTIAMPNITGWSLKEVKAFANLLKIPLIVTGNGYVTSQSIPEGTILNQDSMLTITLEVKFQSSA